MMRRTETLDKMDGCQRRKCSAEQECSFRFVEVTVDNRELLQ